MKILDFIASAARTELRGENGIVWTWHQVMTSADRVKFDLWLVKTDDPLAYQAGTAENRFRQKVERMVELERKKLCKSGDVSQD